MKRLNKIRLLFLVFALIGIAVYVFGDVVTQNAGIWVAVIAGIILLVSLLLPRSFEKEF